MQDCTIDLNEPNDSSEQVHREEEKVTFLLGSHAAPIWVPDDDDEGETTDDQEPPQQQQPQQPQQQPSMEEPGRAVVCCPNAQKEKKLKKGRFIICWRPGGGWAAQWEPTPSSRSRRSAWWATLRTKPAKRTLRASSKKKLTRKPTSTTWASPRRSPRRHSSSAAAADSETAARAQPLPASASASASSAASPPKYESSLMRRHRERLRREWEKNHALLREWVETNGHLPSKDESAVLFYWMHYQRVKRAKLAPDQVAKLRDLGIVPYRSRRK